MRKTRHDKTIFSIMSGCMFKKSYKNHGQARAAIRKLDKKYHVKNRAYRCTHCGLIHLTTKSIREGE